MRVDLADSVRRFWDADAATYDRSPDHGAATPTERAAWSAALARLLPPAPARVLDAAGPGRRADRLAPGRSGRPSGVVRGPLGARRPDRAPAPAGPRGLAPPAPRARPPSRPLRRRAGRRAAAGHRRPSGRVHPPGGAGRLGARPDGAAPRCRVGAAAGAAASQPAARSRAPTGDQRGRLALTRA